MFRFICKYLLKNTTANSLESPHFCVLNSRYFSKNVPSEISDRQKESIFYFLKTHGFTETQISALIKKAPTLFPVHPGKNLEPKIIFLKSYGFSSSDLYNLLVKNPHMLKSSLDKRVIPMCKFLRSVLKDNASVIAAVKSSPMVLKEDVTKHLGPNIAVLCDYGVPESRILTLLRRNPRTLIQSTDTFKSIVKEIKRMGFEPVKSHFIAAVRAMVGLSKSTWKRKWDHYKKWGWSEDEILSVFKRQPSCMAISEEKIERVMDFLVNKMGYEVSKVASCPTVLMHSLENWTIPRCLVVQFLLSKGLVEKNPVLSSVIVPLEKRFAERFVDPYCEEFPEVLTLFDRSMNHMQKIQVYTLRKDNLPL